MSREKGFKQIQRIETHCVECGSLLPPKPKCASNWIYCSKSCKTIHRRKRLGKSTFRGWKYRGILDPITGAFANEETYNRILLAQDYHCAICDQTANLRLDHNHKTGMVRGLLCDLHNKALGMFDDDIEGINRVVKYLTQ